MANLDELLKAFRSREGIKGTNVAKMMSRKEAGNYTTIGSRVSNPFSHPKYNVSSIGRDKHYFLLNRYEKDIAKDLIKSLGDNPLGISFFVLAIEKIFKCFGLWHHTISSYLLP